MLITKGVIMRVAKNKVHIQILWNKTLQQQVCPLN